MIFPDCVKHCARFWFYGAWSTRDLLVRRDRKSKQKNWKERRTFAQAKKVTYSALLLMTSGLPSLRIME
jgi:hypothetical protein